MSMDGVVVNANVFLLDNNSILKRYNDTYTRWRIFNAAVCKEVRILVPTLT
jgi:hypothetical protein